MPDPKSGTEGCIKLKIDRKEADNTGDHDPSYRLRVHRST